MEGHGKQQQGDVMENKLTLHLALAGDTAIRVDLDRRPRPLDVKVCFLDHGWQ